MMFILLIDLVIFPINNLSDTDWNLLNGKGDDVYVTREQFDFEGYQNQFPSKILDGISFVPTGNES